MGPGGGMGMMGGAFGDPAAYLDSLKRELRITPDQEGAWATYADAVKGTAAQMQGVRQSMWDSMPTANWQERRDMMNNMFQAHQQAFDTVHAAAEALLPALS